MKNSPSPSLLFSLLQMDNPVPTNMIGTYIGSPNHTTSYAQVSLSLSLSILFDRTKSRFEHSQNDAMNVGGELGSGDAGYFSTSPQVPYQPATTTATSNNTTATQQLTPQTPNTPTIILTGTLKKKEKEGEEDWF